MLSTFAQAYLSLSSLISVSQMAYSSAMAGIEVAPGASAAGVMGGRASSILGVSNGHFTGQAGDHPFGAEPFPDSLDQRAARLITVKLSPKLEGQMSGPIILPTSSQLDIQLLVELLEFRPLTTTKLRRSRYLVKIFQRVQLARVVLRGLLDLESTLNSPL